MKLNSEQLEPIKNIWRKSTIIRPVFWKAYRYRPTKVYRKVKHHICEDMIYDTILPNLYSKAADTPIDERRVLFYESRYNYLPNSMQLIYQRMKEDPRFDVTFMHVGKANGEEFTREENIRHMKKVAVFAATAKYIFASDACKLLGCLPMRKETVYVQLWHACGAFKGFGMSTAELLFGGDYKTRIRHPLYANTDIVTVSSKEICWAYEEAMDLPAGNIYPIGVSRTDVFFDEKRKEQAKEHLYEHFPAAKGKKVILFAPTFRGHISKAVTSLEFNPDLFAQSLRDDYVLVLKHHPFVKTPPALSKEINMSFAYDASQEMEIEDLLMVADICITDYSSVVFEYSLMGRPMLFYAYDLDDYGDWRGFYYPYDEMTPGPICRTNEEMIEYIRHVDERFDPAEMEAFRERFMGACDGRSTERILETAVSLGDKKRFLAKRAADRLVQKEEIRAKRRQLKREEREQYKMFSEAEQTLIDSLSEQEDSENDEQENGQD